MAGQERKALFVRVERAAGKAAEEAHHSEIELTRAAGDGGVEDAGRPMLVGARVSRPEIAMEARGRLGVPDELLHALRDSVDESARVRIETATSRDREDPFVAVEIGPAAVRGVALLGEADEVVAIETERGRAISMQVSERVSEAFSGGAAE